MKDMIFTGWHFMRWLRLVFGIYLMYEAILNHETVAGFLGAFFLFQAISNTGCSSANSCSIPVQKKINKKVKLIEYQEVK